MSEQKGGVNSFNKLILPRLKPRTGLAVMLAAIRALFFREIQTRFGQYRLGYLWVVIEPALNIGFMLLIFGAVKEKASPGIDFIVFLINGIIPFFMFREICKQSLSAIQSNGGLFIYRPVRPIDALISRSILELICFFIAYIGFSVIAVICDYKIAFSNIPELFFYWCILFIFSISCSLSLMVIGDFSKEISKFINAFFLVIYLMSGIIYSIHIIPQPYQSYLLLNPIIHVVELMRHCISPSYILIEGIQLSYFIYWLLGSLLIGLLLYTKFEKRMMKTK